MSRLFVFFFFWSISVFAAPHYSVVIQKGDTLYSLSKKHDCSMDELVELNQLKDPYILSIHQTFFLCKKEKQSDLITVPNPEDMAAIDYRIQKPAVDIITIAKGDTLYSLSKKYATPMKDIILRNQLKAPYTLSVGQVLHLPGVAYHTVGKKETLYSIAKAYEVGLSDLVRLNKLHAPYILSIDQKIYLPSNNIVKLPVVQKMPTQVSTKKVLVQKRSPKKTSAKKIAKYLPKVPKRQRSKFLWPVKGSIISSFGGKKNGLRNDGINIAAQKGTGIAAAENGVVAYAGNELKGMGNLVILKHADSYMTVYAHANQLLVNRGQIVKRGQRIAKVGSTGRVKKPQLHFEIRRKSQSINPLKYLN